MAEINGFVIENGVLERYRGDETDVVVPEGVTELGKHSFQYSRKLKSISLPETIMKIGSYAFYGCSGLEEIQLPEGIKEIESHTFEDCAELKLAGIPKGVSQIGYFAFRNCEKLTGLVVPSDVLSVEENAFLDVPNIFYEGNLNTDKWGAYCINGYRDGDFVFSDSSRVNLSRYIGKDLNISLPDTLKRISDYAFSGYKNIVSIDIPDSVTYIGSGAFRDCSSMTDITIPDGVTYIGSGAFRNCSSMTGITIPEGIKEIKEYTFTDCESLKDVHLPESLRVIGNNAFDYCTGLSSITIPQKVTRIGAYAFIGCKKLSEIQIPEEVTEIGPNAFLECSKIKTLTLPASIRKIKGEFSSALKTLNVANIETLAMINNDLFRGIRDITVSGKPAGEIESVTVTPDMISAEKPAYLKLFPKATITISDECFSSGNKIGIDYLMMVSLTPWHIANLLVYQTNTKTLTYIRNCITGKNASEVIDECSKIIESSKQLTEKQAQTVVEAALKNCQNVNPEILSRLSYALESKNMGSEELRSKIGSLNVSAVKSEPSQSDSNIDRIISEYNTETEEYIKAQKTIEQRFHFRDSDKLCPVQASVIFLAEYIKLWNRESTYVKGNQFKINVLKKVSPECRSSVADSIVEEINRDELTEFLKSKVEEKNYRLYILPFAKYASEKEINWFIASIRKAKKGGAQERYRAQNSEVAMMLSDTRAAQIYFDKEGLLDRYAAIRGTTADDIRTFSIYSFDLDEDGRKSYDLGSNSVILALNSDMKFLLYDGSTGKELKSIPKKGSDPERYKEAKADIEEKTANVKKVLRGVSNRLFDEFITGKGYTHKQWNDLYLSNPVLRGIAKLIVWEQGGDTFTVVDKGLSDVNGNPYELKELEIKTAHPMEIGRKTTSLWQQYFISKGLKQPFEQIWEPIIDFDKVRSDRYSGCEIPLYRFKDQEKHGITCDFTTWYNYRANKREYESIDIRIKDCSMEWGLTSGDIGDATLQSTITVRSFSVKTISRQTNHIISYLDGCTIYGRILKDDDSVSEGFMDYTAAQVSAFLKFAIENNSTKCTAFLMDYKNEHFSGLNGIDEFTLDID